MNNIAIIGFGSQAKAWALNLRDSNQEFSIGLRSESSSFKKANELGFKTFDYQKASCNFSTFVILTPDHTHNDIIKEILKQNKDAHFILAHGFSYSFDGLKELAPSEQFSLLAPKSIASELRYNYETKAGIAAVIQSKDINSIKELGEKIGVTSFHESSFKEETIADLFSEQSLLCSVLPYAAKLSFEKLIEKGINEQIAYLECWHEIKLIANAMVEKGPYEFFNLISPNALIGGIKGKEILFNQVYQDGLEKIFNEVDSQEFINTCNLNNFVKVKEKTLKEWKNHPINSMHKAVKNKLY
ncbi:MAG: NAD(P)-binding domain-containing protein [Bacteriovoracaceae bacterium]|jgi:ketol-acid reductoisomerase|nr:NAD(P)-binding domain-containing protein [Bacteriovoracaceae bacterium]